MGKPLPGGENRIDERAAQHVALRGDGVVSPPVCATGLSQSAIGGLLGATPRGQPWTSAVPLPPGRNGLGARRRAVLSTFRALSLSRHGHRELMRSVWLYLTPIIAATACHQRNYAERYSRYKLEEPASLVKLREQVMDRLPRVDLPEVRPRSWRRPPHILRSTLQLVAAD